MFWVKDTETSYIPELRNKLKLLEKKYSSYEIEHLETEIIDSLLKKLCPDGKLNISHNYSWKYKKNMKILSDALKVNKTITTLNLSDNRIGKYEENIKILSDALKENHTLTSFVFSRNKLAVNDVTEFSQFKDLKLII